MAVPKTITAIIVTINRPTCVRKCVECLLTQERTVDQVIVADASRDHRTCDVCKEFPGVIYVRHESGEGHTTTGRNLGLLHATGEIIAFLDDDSYAHPSWTSELLAAYGGDSNIGAVGGRALRSTPNESAEGVYEIGQLTRDGSLTGNFGADPGRIVEVDHLIGCNMSFRREVLARFGGFRAGFETQFCIREESDIFMIMKKFGYRILFQPAAVVDHVGAPKPTGQRFGVNWDYFGHRNHYVLLMRNSGIASPIVLRHLLASLIRAGSTFARDLAKATIRLAAVFGGTAAGLLAGAYYSVKQGRDPVRRDAEGRAITRWLETRPLLPEASAQMYEDIAHQSAAGR